MQQSKESKILHSYRNHFLIAFESFVFRFVSYDIASLPNSLK
jgi:hypothetical protein